MTLCHGRAIGKASMERLVFFGKGGIGKSTTAANISATLAATGKRVLHVGCDPKHDSTASLLDGRIIDPIVDRIERLDGLRPEDVVTPSSYGVDCVEAGGPEAGVGCGGRGVSRMLEIFQAAGLVTPARYDVCLYDVLGDVVCGGFASPLRRGVGEKVVIVASEEVMALYAANNIARAVVHYADNGVALAGLVVNMRDNNEDRAPIERFAKLINTRVLMYLPRDPLVREAEYRRMPVVAYAPAAPISRALRDLSEQLLGIDARSLRLPTPLGEAAFYAQVRHRFDAPPGGVGSLPQELPPPGVVTVDRLRGGSARALDPNAEAARRARYETELSAGRRAVRLGRVRADEALRRLKQNFAEARALSVGDLVS